ncbi:MAG TPA: MFS transporter [Candidatus Handelsmanbacteria bacterium]|nr:MFS transporter [Candidatus Handelsmanbacteria bacterium]
MHIRRLLTPFSAPREFSGPTIGGLRNLATVPAGFLTDHYGRCRFILAAMAVSLVVTLFVWSGSFLQVLLIRCLIGIASAFLSPAMGALMADSVPSQNRGRVMADLAGSCGARQKAKKRD